jgi:ribonuclease HII
LTSPLYLHDLDYCNRYGQFAGIDEAGRGALAGPVVIAAVILDYSRPIEGLNDSKLIKPAKREQLYQQIIASALDYAIVEIRAEVIDEINILQASLMGFEQAFNKLQPKPSYCLIDGRDIPKSLQGIATAVIKGDQLHAAIAAASILAKVYRDRLMTECDISYPEYGFARHKGYGTKLHCRNIHSNGFCPIHRKTYHVPDL